MFDAFVLLTSVFDALCLLVAFACRFELVVAFACRFVCCCEKNVVVSDENPRCRGGSLIERIFEKVQLRAQWRGSCSTRRINEKSARFLIPGF